MPVYAVDGRRPSIHADAVVAPDAVVAGAVHLDAGSVVLPGAVVNAQDGEISVGRDCVVMEHAVLRATAAHPLDVGDRVLVGPTASVVGCRIGEDVFLATGTRVFHGAVVGAGAEVRVNAVVHLRTVVGEDTTVPIGWVAVGDPATVLPPSEHEAIWERQEPLDFPGYVYGLPRDTIDGRLMETLAPSYARHFRRLLESWQPADG